MMRATGTPHAWEAKEAVICSGVEFLSTPAAFGALQAPMMAELLEALHL